MAWYRAGSVSVTNGNTAVAGSGTSWVDNVKSGHVFVGPDGLSYEVVTVVSATAMTIYPAYRGATSSEAGYGILSTQLFVRELANALNMIYGHMDFLERNTGVTNNPKVDKFVLNPEGILSNNRHFIADTHMEYQPNGDATTEGQSLLITSFVYAYLATGDARFKAAAEKAFDAYVQFFYAGDPIPDTPDRWIANWLVNGKGPCLAHYPRNLVDPTYGGFKCVPLMFVNGLAQIPHGAPFWGEYLDVATFAHRGMMAWNAINATPKPTVTPIDFNLALSNRITETPSDTSQLAEQFKTVNWAGMGGDPVIDWSGGDMPEIGIEWIVAWTGNRIGIERGPDDQLWSGKILESGLPQSEYGKLQLTDTSVNGVYFLNFAVRLPVALGGYMFARNEVWHNRPVHAPMVGDAELRGNAADGEVWFADACHAMWKVFGNGDTNSRYYKAWKACEYTAMEYMEIDRTDKFFRRSRRASTPFTDGISYDFSYPSGVPAVYGRDAGGYITIQKPQAVKHSMEQQAIAFAVDTTASIRTTWGGLTVGGAPLSVEVMLGVSGSRTGENEVLYEASLANSSTEAAVQVNTPITDFVRVADDNGEDYLVAKLGAVTDYGGCVPSASYETGVFDGRAAVVVKALFPDDNAGFIIGAWLTSTGLFKPSSIIYRATHDFNLRIEDVNGWRWYWMLRATSGSWVNKALQTEDIILSGWQPNHPDATVFPGGPSLGDGMSQFQVLLDAPATNAEFSYYALNTPPPRFSDTNVFVTKYRVTIVGEDAFTAKLGDCTVTNSKNGNLFCVPGVVPFSNIYVVGAEQFGAWHGMPYPGYQYPWLFVHATTGSSDPDVMLNNSVHFLWDSQRYVKEEMGVLGPGASAFIWDRWDNAGYGETNTWTMYHWGDGHAWDGYQPRAFFAAARAWLELVVSGRTVPTKLVEYTENWLNWLVDFCRNLGTDDNPSYRATPTFFPSTTKPVPVEGDFTGHMTGLWLAGASMAKMAGSQVKHLDWFMDFCLDELARNYVIGDAPDDPMNGSWSPWAGGGMFFGFWAPEILRGLSLYVLARYNDPNESTLTEKKHRYRTKMAIAFKVTKQPIEVQDVVVDFSGYLDTYSDSIASFSVVAEEGINISNTQQNGASIYMRVHGGTENSMYKVTVTITTVAKRVKQSELLVRVFER